MGRPINYAYITVSKDQVIFEGPYKQGFINDIKTIPQKFRAWDPENKIWTVHKNHLGWLEYIVKKHYTHAQLVDGGSVTDLHTGEETEQLEIFE